MSTLIVSAAGQIGSSLVRTAGQVALSYANQAISRAFDNRTFEGPRLESFHIQTSRDGAPMPRVYGRSRLAGQVIWASKLKETVSEESVGGKGGGPTQRNYSYSISFAIGLCEGEIVSVEQLWANGNVLAGQNHNYRVYKGTESQSVDPIISAIDGVQAPAFRGTAYIVFEDFPLDDFGRRLPQINVEVLRIPESIGAGERLETLVSGVNLLPSSGEYAYSPVVAEEQSAPGQSRALNMNNGAGKADFLLALDQLENQLPNCRSVSLIISWFGDDLRCGLCKLRPGIEDPLRFTPDAEWNVGPDERDTAYQVSRDEEHRPRYGGTPSDQSIIDCIRTLKSRGYSVTIYPFILMDISPDNMLPNPYGGVGQPAFPWRGRITSSVAPGFEGTPDLTSDVSDEISNFFGEASAIHFGIEDERVTYSGDAEDYGFRRFILHYATLAQIAGGVDRFIIGSEMRELTTLRSARSAYPAVSQFVSLATEVKSIVGANTQLSYAADWSEYFGHQPADGSGDVHFHLDSLWSHDAIAAVGIDAYFPLSDWRDGTGHLDADITPDIYDLSYLRSNVEGGEGYDWYYASASDRAAQIRTSITDGAYAKDWMFKYKDLRNWWQNTHVNRVSGVETVATDWIPQSKPFWLLEIGCPAIDKGANQPNVFVDSKSSESFAPYFSAGTRDDLIQRRYIEAFISYYIDTENNPLSSVYGSRMVDMDALNIWCWDARPYPAFPGLEVVWSDGPNWELGHWLTGRAGLIPLADVVADLTRKSGVENFDVTKVNGLVQGYVIDRPMTTRAALEPLALIYGFHVLDTAGGLRFVSEGAEARVNLLLSDIVGVSPQDIEYLKEDNGVRLRDVRMHFIDASRDYQLGSVSAQNRAAETVRILDVNAPIVMDHGYATFVAKRLLAASIIGDRAVTFSVGPSRLDLEVGDIVTLDGDSTNWQIESLEGQSIMTVRARQIGEAGAPRVSGSMPEPRRPPIWIPEPELIVLDIPSLTKRSGPLVGVQMSPFATVRVSSEDGEVTLNQAAQVGTLLTNLPRGPVGRWDQANSFEISLPNAALSAQSDLATLSGGNRFAVETAKGWEILQAQSVTLIANGRFRLSRLLRGQLGTDFDMQDVIPAGARIVVLDNGLEEVKVSDSKVGAPIILTVEAAGRATSDVIFDYKGRHLRPFAPVHPELNTTADSLDMFWIRRTRLGGDNWSALEVPLSEAREFYRVQVMNGQNLLFETEIMTPDVSLSSQMISEATHLLIAQGSELYGYGAELRVELSSS